MAWYLAKHRDVVFHRVPSELQVPRELKPAAIEIFLRRWQFRDQVGKSSVLPETIFVSKGRQANLV